MADPVQFVASNPSFQAIGTPRSNAASEHGGLQTSQLDPDYYLYSKAGKRFFSTHTVATAVAPLQVVPTTTAAFVINNVDTSSSGKNLILLRVGLYFASGTAGNGVSLWGGASNAPLATQLTTNGTGVTIGTGRGTADPSIAWSDMSKGFLGSWELIGGMDSQAPAVPGFALVVDVAGMFVVRPTYAFGLHAVAGAGTSAKFSFYATWLEIPGNLP